MKLPPNALVDWLDGASPYLYLSVITAAEVADGIAKKEREGAVRKAATLCAWWDTVEHLYADRILPFDLPTARIAGRLMDHARSRGQDPGSPTLRSRPPPAGIASPFSPETIAISNRWASSA